jgi:cell wall assembly regulator SMI1
MGLNRFGELLSQSQSIEVGRGASPIEIQDAQQALGAEFPRSYRQFLRIYSWAKLKHDYVFGLGGDVPKHFNVVEVTKSEREEVFPILPRHLIPIMNDGAGNHYCLDTRQRVDDETPVVFWDHEAVEGDSQTPDLVSPSFEAWIVATTLNALE